MLQFLCLLLEMLLHLDLFLEEEEKKKKEPNNNILKGLEILAQC